MSILPVRPAPNVPGRPVYIYALSDPRTGLIRYIGRTVNPRQWLSVHGSPVSTRGEYHRSRWLASLRSNGVRPEMTILAVGTEATWADLERQYIAAYRAAGCDLVNTADGGQGTVGFSHSQDAREKIRQAGVGRTKTEAQRRAISERMIGAKSPGTEANRRRARAESDIAFSLYLALGDQRSLHRLVSEHGYKWSTVCYWSRRDDWNRRAGGRNVPLDLRKATS